MGDEDVVDVGALADLATPWFVRVAVTLRLANHIDGGTTDVEGLAAAAGATVEGVWAVLVHLSGKGVFTSPAPGLYEMNDAARRLLAQGGNHFLDLDGIGGRFSGAWAGLLELVRSGQPGYEQVFGLPFWDDLAAHPDLGRSFDEAMAHGHSEPERVPKIAGGWEEVASVVDVGGGIGHVLANLLEAQSHLHGTLVDLPPTAERAGVMLEARGLAGRFTIVGQSFFDPLPFGADVYLLSGVLNDWPDAEAAQILGGCAGAAPEGGRVIVAGGVRADDAPPRIQMDKLVTGGRDRTLKEFRSMANDVGLEVVAADGAIECRKARSTTPRR
jgi:hypothetical protein